MSADVGSAVFGTSIGSPTKKGENIGNLMDRRSKFDNFCVR